MDAIERAMFSGAMKAALSGASVYADERGAMVSFESARGWRGRSVPASEIAHYGAVRAAQRIAEELRA